MRDLCVSSWGGQPGDEPYFNGLNQPSIFRAGQWFEMGGVSGGQSPGFGTAGDIPTYALGKRGIFRPSTGSWCFDNDSNFNWTPGVDVCYTGGFGIAGDQPVVTLDGMIGVYRASNHTFYFDQDGNKQWSSGDTIHSDFASAGELSLRASR